MLANLVGALLVVGHDALEVGANLVGVGVEITEGLDEVAWGEVTAVADELLGESEVAGNATRLDGIAEGDGGHAHGIGRNDGVGAGSDEEVEMGDDVAYLTIVEGVDVEDVDASGGEMVTDETSHLTVVLIDASIIPCHMGDEQDVVVGMEQELTDESEDLLPEASIEPHATHHVVADVESHYPLLAIGHAGWQRTFFGRQDEGWVGQQNDVGEAELTEVFVGERLPGIDEGEVEERLEFGGRLVFGSHGASPQNGLHALAVEEVVGENDLVVVVAEHVAARGNHDVVGGHHAQEGLIGIEKPLLEGLGGVEELVDESEGLIDDEGLASAGNELHVSVDAEPLVKLHIATIAKKLVGRGSDQQGRPFGDGFASTVAAIEMNRKKVFHERTISEVSESVSRGSTSASVSSSFFQTKSILEHRKRNPAAT